MKKKNRQQTDIEWLGLSSILLAIASYAALKAGAEFGAFTDVGGILLAILAIVKRQRLSGYIGLALNLAVVALFIYILIIISKAFHSPQFQNSWHQAWQNN